MLIIKHNTMTHAHVPKTAWHEERERRYVSGHNAFIPLLRLFIFWEKKRIIMLPMRECQLDYKTILQIKGISAFCIHNAEEARISLSDVVKYDIICQLINLLTNVTFLIIKSRLSFRVCSWYKNIAVKSWDRAFNFWGSKKHFKTT